MALRIGGNSGSLFAQRQLAEASENYAAIVERLSSGYRINRPADDPASLAVAASLASRGHVLNRAILNLNDGLSAVNVAEGALRELSAITTRQLELAEQAANGVLNSSQRRALTAEAHALADEFNRIVRSTSFNGRALIDEESNSGQITLQAGFGSEGAIQFALGHELDRTVGTGTFAAERTYQSDNNTTTKVAAGDLDGDGDMDLVTSGLSVVGGIGVVPNNGDDTAKEAAPPNVPPPRPRRTVTAAPPPSCPPPVTRSMVPSPLRSPSEIE